MYIAVGSESDCISRDREFDSGLARLNSFAEIGHGIISTAPASIHFRSTRLASETRFGWPYAGGLIVAQFYML